MPGGEESSSADERPNRGVAHFNQLGAIGCALAKSASLPPGVSSEDGSSWSSSAHHSTEPRDDASSGSNCSACAAPSACSEAPLGSKRCNSSSPGSRRGRFSRAPGGPVHDHSKSIGSCCSSLPSTVQTFSYIVISAPRRAAATIKPPGWCLTPYRNSGVLKVSFHTVSLPRAVVHTARGCLRPRQARNPHNQPDVHNTAQRSGLPLIKS